MHCIMVEFKMKHGDLHEPFHKRLRRLREQKKISSSQFARQIGVAQSTYSDWENGRGLKLPPYECISQVLAITVSELVTGQKGPTHELYEIVTLLEKQLAELKTKLGSVI